MAEQNVGNGEVKEAKAGKLELAQKPEKSSDAQLAVREEEPKGELEGFTGYLGDRPI